MTRPTYEEVIELLRELVEILDPEEGSWPIDGSLCDYFRKQEGLPYGGDGTCSFSCTDEPACMTCIPKGGWPLQRAHRLLEAS